MLPKLNWIRENIFSSFWVKDKEPETIKFFTTGSLDVAYKDFLDGGGRTFGQQFFELFSEICYFPSGRVLEWCCGPAFIGFGILSKFDIEHLVLHDINPEVSSIIKKTLEKNKLRKVSFYCSTSVNQIPLQKFDLIVANPPHFSSRNQFSSEFVEDQIIYDFGWEAHRLFFDQIANYMTDNSLIILQENNRGSVTDDFRLFIHQSDLHILKSIGDKGVLTSEDNFYFILLRKNKSR